MQIDLSEERLTVILEKLRKHRDLAHAAVLRGADDGQTDLVAAIWDGLYEMHVAFVENLLGIRDSFPLPTFLLADLDEAQP